MEAKKILTQDEETSANVIGAGIPRVVFLDKRRQQALIVSADCCVLDVSKTE